MFFSEKQSISQRVGIRQLPRVCLDSEKCVAVLATKQGGTADRLYSSLTEAMALSGTLFFYTEP